MKKIIFILAYSFLLSACVVMPEHVSLNPTIKSSNFSVARGKTIILTVDDARENATIGVRPNALGSVIGAPISTDAQFISNVKNELESTLTKDGFHVLEQPQADATTLNVKMTALNYETAPHLMYFDLIATSVVDVNAVNGSKEFNHQYRAQLIRTVLVTPTSGADREMINDVLSRSLEKMIRDKNLLIFLS